MVQNGKKFFKCALQLQNGPATCSRVAALNGGLNLSFVQRPSFSFFLICHSSNPHLFQTWFLNNSNLLFIQYPLFSLKSKSIFFLIYRSSNSHLFHTWFYQSSNLLFIQYPLFSIKSNLPFIQKASFFSNLPFIKHPSFLYFIRVQNFFF